MRLCDTVEKEYKFVYADKNFELENPPKLREIVVIMTHSLPSNVPTSVAIDIGFGYTRLISRDVPIVDNWL